MIDLGARTLALAASLSAAVFLFVPLFLRYLLDAEEERGLLYWSAGAAALGSASLTAALWGFDGREVAILLGNTLAVLGFGWLYLASRRLLGIAEGHRYVYPLAEATLVLGAAFTFVFHNDAARIIMTSLLLAVFSAASAWLFVRRRADLPPLVAYVTAMIFTMISLLYLARTVGFTRVALIDGVDSAPDAVTSLPFLFEVVFNTWLAAMLAVVVSARIQARLRLEHDRVDDANRELMVLSTTDPLTGLATRNRVDEVLRVQTRRAAARGVPVAVILLSSVRETDTVGRWGGEEFIVILPESGAAGAAETAERIRRSIAAADFGIERPVTASLGVTNHRDQDDPGRLVARADAALYEAKNAGRNRVLVA